MQAERFDRIIIGAGLYGLYAALFCCRKKEKVLVLEADSAPFARATTVNQARVHQGYHYPRSISTALKSAGYFERFNRDFGFCINREFRQIYATSASFSWTDGKQFRDFCRAAGIPCEEVSPDNYFREGMCDGAFQTREYAYDAGTLKEWMLEKLADTGNRATILYNINIAAIDQKGDVFEIRAEDGRVWQASFVLNAAYAGTNQILALAGFEPFRMKYELCEITLCTVNEKLKDVGITVMDGPFFSVMPFGKTGVHSLTAVAFTPHTTCYDPLPSFPCQDAGGVACSLKRLGNCNACPAKPATAFPYMAGLARKYLRDEYAFSYRESLFSMKPVLMSSEIDDSRPTVIRVCSEHPAFVGVLSGKINTVYDLDEVLSR